LQHAFDGADDFTGGQPVGTLEDPHGLDHPYNMPVYPGALRLADCPSRITHTYGRVVLMDKSVGKL
jgi:hypothetical protein